MKKCTLIYNPESGVKNKAKFVELFQDVFEKASYQVTIKQTEKRGDATKFIETLEETDLVVVAGGDGTLNEAVTGNLHRKNPLLLSYLPLGTTNDVGTMYGFGKNMRSNIERILEGTIQEIDVCTINEKPFIYVACFGNYVNVSYDTPRRLKKKYGKLAYVLYAIKQLLKEEIHKHAITYTVNGKTYQDEYSFLFITNTSHLAGLGLESIYKDVKLNDHMFEVAFCKVQSRKDILNILYCLKTMDLHEIPNITYYQTDQIDIVFDENLTSSWCVDGEKLEKKSKAFHLEVKKGFKMIVPKDNITKLFNES